MAYVDQYMTCYNVFAAERNTSNPKLIFINLYLFLYRFSWWLWGVKDLRSSIHATASVKFPLGMRTRMHELLFSKGEEEMAEQGREEEEGSHDQL